MSVNSSGKFAGDHAHGSLRVNCDEPTFELLFEGLDDFLPGGVSFGYGLLSILFEDDKAFLLESGDLRMNFSVEELTGNWIKSSVLKTANTVINLLVQHDYSSRLDVGSLQHLKLRESLREAI